MRVFRRANSSCRIVPQSSCGIWVLACFIAPEPRTSSNVISHGTKALSTAWSKRPARADGNGPFESWDSRTIPAQRLPKKTVNKPADREVLDHCAVAVEQHY